MAVWPILPDGNGSSFDCYDIIRNLRINGFCLGFYYSAMEVIAVQESEDKDLRGWFDRILVDILKEVSVGGDFRPLPVMLGNGRNLDLFKLFWVVRENGGFSSFTNQGLWASVGQECGLSVEAAASIKLVYFKYLDCLDQWVQRFCKHKDIGEDVACCRVKLGVMLVKLDSEFRDFFYDQRKKVNQEDEKNNENTDNKCIDDVTLLDPSTVNEEMFSSKRRRETLSGIVNWVREISLDLENSTVEKAVETSEQEKIDYHGLTLSARIAMFCKEDHGSAEGSPQKKQKICSSMYDGVFKGVRSSPSLLSPRNAKAQSCAKQLHEISGSSTSKKVDPFNARGRTSVPIGPRFQAEVPEWTGVASESDLKWLGTQHWPVITEEQNLFVGIDSIGKGRQDSCDCQVPGSINCVKFHIAETRLRVKLDLGPAFYYWRFQFMGEEVSISWTGEEENILNSIVKTKSESLEKCFWEEAHKRLPNRKDASLVSYYFNVFLLWRRCFQNRVIPYKISSDEEPGDDDNKEFCLWLQGNR